MDFDYSFYSFNTNLKIALVLPTLKYGPESDIDWAWIDTRALYRLAINQIITSLELYYESIFKIISGYIKISKIHPKSLVFFIKIYGLEKKFFKEVEKQNSLDFELSNIIPEFLLFQSGEKIKTAMELINLDPIGQFNKEWEITYGNQENSTVKLRHSFTHKGMGYSTIMRIPISKITTPKKVKKQIYAERYLGEIKERIKNAIVLVSYLENQIVKKYSF